MISECLHFYPKTLWCGIGINTHKTSLLLNVSTSQAKIMALNYPSVPKVPFHKKNVVPRSEDELIDVFIRKRTRPQLPPAPVNLKTDCNRAEIPSPPVPLRTNCLDKAQIEKLKELANRISQRTCSSPQTPMGRRTVLLSPGEIPVRPVSGRKRTSRPFHPYPRPPQPSPAPLTPPTRPQHGPN